ncbi:arylsulfatase [Novipirellula artificiosorum]|uniref:Arylsulfatase n=1 Tax=Novipirellula artificiosorum TaxID=2528016 RepID=A0A5C6D581_9BACT|nr:arylsulfatase [Novipirellula artificiosorum]TWU31185.1 Arylsulfatase [Novipirellula artificiosorum]
MMHKFIFAVMFSMLGTTSWAADNRPNIIYIMADDLGYGDLSCFGQTKFKTPNIDRLAAEGITFTDYYAGSTVCAPTRCVLMSGLHTGHAFVRGNREVQPEGQAPMPIDIVTLPRLIKKAGYTTGMFGKWGLGAPGSASDPVEHFDTFYGYNCQRQAHTFYPTHLWHNDKKVPLDSKTYSADLISDQLLQFVRDNKEKPFFAYVPFTIPHAAMHVPEDDHLPWREKWPQFDDKIGKYSGPNVTNPVAAFAGMVTRMDRHVGQLLALLEELGIDNNTIVSFTSDNGPHMEGGHDPKFFDSNGPLKGHKRDLYEGGIRVPFVARWPGTIKPGTKTDLPVAMWDVLPTCLEIAGTEAPAGIDGISYLPALLGQMDRQKKHEYLYWAFYERGGKLAVRWGKWKGVRNNVGKNPNSTLELYDLTKDIGETSNIAAQHPEVVTQLETFLKDAYTPSPDWSFGGR